MANPTSGIKDKVEDLASSASRTAGQVKTKAQEQASQAADKLREGASTAMDKAKDLASTAADKVQGLAATAAGKAQETASNFGNRAEDAVGSVGESMTSLAGTIRERGPREGTLGSVTATVADSLESGGQYLREEGLSGLADDLTGLIRRYPVQSLVAGLCVGFLLARAIRD